jgi:FixJ family two-component response regulator
MAEQKKNSVEEFLAKMPKKKADEIRELISKAVIALREREREEGEPSERDKRLAEIIKREQNIPKITLESLLAGVTKDNIHPEIDSGPPIGQEIW